MVPDVPRLAFEELDEALKSRLAARVQRLGYLGEFFQSTAHLPTPLGHFIDYTESLKALAPKNLCEVAIISVAQMRGNAYELHQHERLCLKSGFSRDWIAAVEACEPDATDLLAPTERAVQTYAMAVVRQDPDASMLRFGELVGLLGVDTALALMMIVGRYVAHSAMIDSLGIKANVKSIWAPDFEG